MWWANDMSDLTHWADMSVREWCRYTHTHTHTHSYPWLCDRRWRYCDVCFVNVSTIKFVPWQINCGWCFAYAVRRIASIDVKIHGGILPPSRKDLIECQMRQFTLYIHIYSFVSHRLFLVMRQRQHQNTNYIISLSSMRWSKFPFAFSPQTYTLI